MKITFISFGYQNIGIQYLSAYLTHKGFETSLVFDPGLFNTYHLSADNASKFFNSEEKKIKDVISEKPDVIGFSVMSDNWAWASNMAKELKLRLPDTPIIMGGIHPTSLPEKIIKHDFVDFVCVGEGEEATADLLTAIAENKPTNNIPNIYTIQNDTLYKNPPRHFNEDLDLLPLPDTDLYFNEYKGFMSPIYMTMSSRGCPYRCTYCYNSHLMETYKGRGKYLRQFSPARFIEELKYAKDTYNPKRLAIVDDVFTLNIEWMKEFFKLYKKEIDLPFGCLVHPLMVDEDKIKLLKDGGCTVVGMGIQTVNEHIKKTMIDRPETNAQVAEKIALFKKYGILTFVDFIFGIPKETEEDALNAARFVSKTQPDAVSSLWLRYYPKARIIDLAKENGLLSIEQENIINDSMENLPVSGFGNARINFNPKLGTLLLIACNIPPKVTEFIIKHKLYKLLPPGNYHHQHTLFKQLFNKIFRGRNGSLYSCLRMHFKYYFTYLFRSFK